MNDKRNTSKESASPTLIAVDEVHLNIQQGQLWGALRYLNQLIAREPPSAEIYRLRGWVHHELHDVQSARRDLIQAVELEPEDPDSHLFLGLFLIDVRKLEWGIAELNQVFAAPTPASTTTQTCAYIGRQEAYKLLGRFDEALVDLNAAIELEPERCLFCLRGQLYLRLERFAAAEEDFAMLVEKQLTNVTMQGNAESFGLRYFSPWGLLKELNLPVLY
jgi:tetratricopeptide (TPR) repeat protein